MRLYADASALVKLAAEEAESAALRQYLTEQDAEVVTSVVARVEVGRAMRRVGVREPNPLAGAHLVELDDDLIATAIELEPTSLRAVDAIHLATALRLRDDTDVFLAYDQRLLAAAEAAGLKTASPR